MIRYSRLILAEDFKSWLPAIITVTLITVLVGVSANQFTWTHNEVFMTAVALSGHDILEFRIVSETIYLLVAPLAFLALTVVGSATVERVRATFAQWRLVGASPKQVRRSIWTIVAIAAGIGAFVGSILTIPASYVLIPAFNLMAVSDFVGPQFQPSLVAWLLSFSLSFITCWFGAYAPAIRASKVGPVEVFRKPSGVHSRMWWRLTLAAILLLSSLGLMIAPGFISTVDAGVAVMFNLALNAGMMAVIAVYLLGSTLTVLLLRFFASIANRLRLVTATTACRAASERTGTSTNTLAPLAAGIGGAGVLLVSTAMSTQIIHATGYQGEVNLTDTLIMLAIISVVCLITSAAVVALSGRDIEREQSLLRVAGMSPGMITRWYGWQAVALAATAIVMALIPISIAVATAALGAHALIGELRIAIPWSAVAIGFIASSAVLFFIMYLPAKKPLGESVATGLRR